MKIARLAKYLVPALFSLTFAQVSAATITFNFLELVESQTSEVTGKLGNGADFSGLPEEGSYDFFTWVTPQGLSLTATAEYWPEDENGEVIGIVPSHVYLQKSFAGLGVCREPQADNLCGAADTKLSYSDRLILSFSEVVEIVNIEFSIGEDDSHIGPDDDDYRAYNTRLNATGSSSGSMSDLVGTGDHWSGSLFGNQLALFRPEGTGSYVESITVKTKDVPEPESFGLLMMGLALAGLGGRYRRQQVM